MANKKDNRKKNVSKRQNERSERFEKMSRGNGRNENFKSAATGKNIIAGRNAVTAALESGREIEKVVVADGTGGSVKKIIAVAKERKLKVEYRERSWLDRFYDGAHQGVIAFAAAHKYSTVDEILAAAEGSNVSEGYSTAEGSGVSESSSAAEGSVVDTSTGADSKTSGDTAYTEQPFIIILDDLEDPHNLGAIMRTAECAGAHGIIIGKNNAVGLTETVAKASAGAIEYMKVARVTNIGRTIDELKERGVWVAACDMDGVSYTGADLTGPIAIVIGNEGKGISRLVKEKCDFVVSIPMLGKISSLNASNAAAILMYEIRRQRDGAAQ